MTNTMKSIAAALALSLAGPATAADEELVKSGTISIEQVQVAWLVSGNVGGGTLTFGGKTYNFSVGGLGVGGIGVSKLTATGTVYNLTSIDQFEGAYGQARSGFAAADEGKGQLWLENTSGVYIELAAERKGLALSLGADAVYIELD